MSRFGSRAVPRTIAGNRLDRWLWSAERVRWARRLAAGMCRFPTLDALRASRLWSREAARLERFLD
ncbi:MAG: hypothetical protein V1774_09770, partial [Candidatus Eisenbacteria bacterium]